MFVVVCVPVQGPEMLGQSMSGSGPSKTKLIRGKQTSLPMK